MIGVLEGREEVDDLMHRNAAYDLEVLVWGSPVGTRVVGSGEEESALRSSKQQWRL